MVTFYLLLSIDLQAFLLFLEVAAAIHTSQTELVISQVAALPNPKPESMGLGWAQE